MIKLDIGAGRDPQPGYIPVDAYNCYPGYVRALMWCLPWGDGSVDEIYSSHALEHIPKQAVVPTLAEWLRVLKPGCCAKISVPDLEWCCRNWLEHKDNGWNLDALFGNQETPGEFHMTGFTASIMLAYLKQAGFGNVQHGQTMNHRQNTLMFQAWKAL